MNSRIENDKIILELTGRIDTSNASQVESEIEEIISANKGLTPAFDAEKLEYISSAGLRVLLTALQIMEEQGEMKIRHVSESVMEIFEITGFLDILTVE
jgi:anti-sigma B factor antagonist